MKLPLWEGSYQAYNFTTIQPSLLTFLGYLLHGSSKQRREQFSQTKAFHSQPCATHTVAKPGLSRSGWEGGTQWGPSWDVQPCHALFPSSHQVFCCTFGVSNVTGTMLLIFGYSVSASHCLNLPQKESASNISPVLFIPKTLMYQS